MKRGFESESDTESSYPARLLRLLDKKGEEYACGFNEFLADRGITDPMKTTPSIIDELIQEINEDHPWFDPTKVVKNAKGEMVYKDDVVLTRHLMRHFIHDDERTEDLLDDLKRLKNDWIKNE